ncbi:MAG TPA: FlgD immunoglobulin-like domain containing protein [bacterium]|nr:FlgD immunoglobulin-like domain containing protein [bacterium]HPR89070.1 FlgD immunoglobulin-like domain containing protein [bacterium]
MFRQHTLAVLILAAGLLRAAAQTPAFPGAEGAGRYTTGGRGGAVYEVTNLNDSGSGSLRDAISKKGPRTIVFRVSGTIRLKSDLKIANGDLTIAGQSAPGDGICLRDQATVIGASNVILRYLRFRLGDSLKTEDDAIWGRYYKKIIIDHCSASWSVDESMSFYANDSLTIQWCLIAESLYLSTHPKGAHGYGGIWGGTNVSFHHNLFAHHSSRNPRFDGSNAPCINVDYRNNVIYNWGFNSAYGGEGGTINMVANYYKYGPATKSGVRYRIVEPSDGKGKWYIEENYVTGAPAITANNWAGGVQGSYGTESVSRVHEPHPFVPITQHSAEEAYTRVLTYAGAILPKRDAVDSRVIQDVISGTATFEGTGYERANSVPNPALICGIIDSQSQVGGWPQLFSLPAPEDGDHDGMPDYWESANGLNPADAADRNLTNAEGYTWLEVYLNGLAGATTAVAAAPAAAPAAFALAQNYPNPFNSGTTVTFALPADGVAEGLLFDITGRLVRRMPGAPLDAGIHAWQWDGREEGGRPAASGLYLFVLRAGSSQRTIKLQLIR